MQYRIQLINILLLLALLPFGSSAQNWPWAKRVGGNSPVGVLGCFGISHGQFTKDLTTDFKGNVYSLSFAPDSLLQADGTALSGWGKFDNVLSSFDCSGRYRWSKVIGTTHDSEFTCSIRTDQLGNIYAFGKIALTQGGHFGPDTTLAYSPKSIFLVKWDSAGRFQWLRMPQPDTISYATSIRETAPIDMDVDDNGDVHLLCYLSPGLHGGSYMVASSGACVLKYNGSGQLISGVPIPIQLTAIRSSREFLWGSYGFTFSEVLNQYLVAGSARLSDISVPQPRPGLVRVGTQVIAGEARGFFASFNASSGSLIKLITRPSSAPASDRGVWLHSRPENDELGNVYLSGYAWDSSQFNGFMFRNPRSKEAPLPFVIKIDGMTGALRWTQYGQTSIASNIYLGGMSMSCFQLGLSNGKVLMAGRFGDSLFFNGATLSKPTVADSLGAFLLELDATTGKLRGAAAYGFGSGSVANTLSTAITSDKRGNFYIGGWYVTPSIVFGSNTLQNPDAPKGYRDGFIAKWGIASCSCAVPSPSYTTGSITGATRRYTYTGTTTGIDSLVWSWGDGTTQKISSSFTAVISHTFPTTTATYEVCVTAYSRTCGSNQSCSRPVPVAVGSIGKPDESITIYPNPGSTAVTVGGGRGSQLVVRSIQGATMFSCALTNNAQTVDVAALPLGVYLFSISSLGGTQTTLRFVKQ